jgi:hypothetical protein
MKRILVIYYSQSGDVANVVDHFVRGLHDARLEVVTRQIQPAQAYPYPWRTPLRLFDVFPECILGLPPEIEPVVVEPGEPFDLVVVAYQVWFLAPSLPIQAFLKSSYARPLRDTPVVTISVSRNLWHMASETMKRLLAESGAVHIDNVVVTHAGPPWTTFISVLRGVLWGRKDRLWGIFPSGEIAPRDLERMARLGRTVAEKLVELDGPPRQSLLAGMPTAQVLRRYLIPECIAWYFYRAWARGILWAGARGRWARTLATAACMLFVLLLVLVALPLGLLGFVVLYPLIQAPLDRYARRVGQPSVGGASWS